TLPPSEPMRTTFSAEGPDFVRSPSVAKRESHEPTSLHPQSAGTQRCSGSFSIIATSNATEGMRSYSSLVGALGFEILFTAAQISGAYCSNARASESTRDTKMPAFQKKLPAPTYSVARAASGFSWNRVAVRIEV